MIEFQIEPLASWGRAETKSRKPSTFRTSYDDTLKLIREELRLLGVTDTAVIAVVTKRADSRAAGALRARANVSHPGVQLSAVTKYGPKTWATDRYKTTYYDQGDSWRANLHAIALTLGALRAVDRYGTTSTGEQYVGWTAIEGTRPVMAADEAEAYLLSFDRDEVLDPSGHAINIERVYRTARSKTHPDRLGGSREAWNQVEAAGDVLRAAGRLR